MDSLPAVLLGLAFGIQHATDPDHVLAVATIVSRTRRFTIGALVGAFWGVGHTMTLAAVGAAIIFGHLTITPALGLSMELGVAIMLMVLGALRLLGVFRGSEPVAVTHLTEAHGDHHAPTIHSHSHVHGDHVHRHPHVHPPMPLVRAVQAVGFAQALRSVAVGIVHGMAGSAAMTLLVLSTIRSLSGAVAYLLVFSLGTIIGMTAITALLSLPFSLTAPRLLRWRRQFALATGVLSLGFGLYLAIQVGMTDGLFMGRPTWTPR